MSLGGVCHSDTQYGLLAIRFAKQPAKSNIGQTSMLASAECVIVANAKHQGLVSYTGEMVRPNME